MKEFFTFVLLDGLLLFGLFYGITFLVALVQQQSGVRALTKQLESAPLGMGNVYAAAAGAITPFCSCSTIPVLSGMLRARIRFGICMTFLMASPLVNEAVIIVMASFFGLGHTALFVLLALGFPIVAGVGLDLLGVQHLLKDRIDEEVPGEVIRQEGQRASIPWQAKARFAEVVARTEIKSVAGYILVGLLIGGAIHGFIPQDWIVSLTDRIGATALIPLMALLGAPLYFNMPAAVPVAFALTDKGLNFGAVIAFLVAGGGMSIPEMALLLKIFQPKLLAIYVLTMLLTAIAMGYIFSYTIGP